MAKGMACPSCGEVKFQKKGAVYKCSACQAVGFWETPKGPGSGKGATCGSCKGATVREVYADNALVLKHCSTCQATFVLAVP
jgi:uncharacterized Zn finger protein (UPF0148 family)